MGPRTRRRHFDWPRRGPFLSQAASGEEREPAPLPLQASGWRSGGDPPGAYCARNVKVHPLLPHPTVVPPAAKVARLMASV